MAKTIYEKYLPKGLLIPLWVMASNLPLIEQRLLAFVVYRISKKYTFFLLNTSEMLILCDCGRTRLGEAIRRLCKEKYIKEDPEHSIPGGAKSYVLGASSIKSMRIDPERETTLEVARIPNNPIRIPNNPARIPNSPIRIPNNIKEEKKTRTKKEGEEGNPMYPLSLFLKIDHYSQNKRIEIQQLYLELMNLPNWQNVPLQSLKERFYDLSGLDEYDSIEVIRHSVKKQLDCLYADNRDALRIADARRKEESKKCPVLPVAEKVSSFSDLKAAFKYASSSSRVSDDVAEYQTRFRTLWHGLLQIPGAPSIERAIDRCAFRFENKHLNVNVPREGFDFFEREMPEFMKSLGEGYSFNIIPVD